MSMAQRSGRGPTTHPERTHPLELETRSFLTSRIVISSSLLVSSCLCFSAPGYGQETLWQRYKAAGSEAAQQGRYEEAERLLRAGLDQAGQFGSLDPRLADSLNQLAVLYATQHQYAQAEPLFQRSLGVSVAALGPDHPHVAIVLRN